MENKRILEKLLTSKNAFDSFTKFFTLNEIIICSKLNRDIKNKVKEIKILQPYFNFILNDCSFYNLLQILYENKSLTEEEKYILIFNSFIYNCKVYGKLSDEMTNHADKNMLQSFIKSQYSPINCLFRIKQYLGNRNYEINSFIELQDGNIVINSKYDQILIWDMST